MSRLKLWGILFVSSVVTLVSLLRIINAENFERHERWLISVMIISILFSILGAITTLLPPEKVLKAERFMILICLGIWAAGAPALMDPDNEMAVGRQYNVLNANLYFFGWAALISGICLTGDAVKQMNGDEASPVALKWFMLAAASFVVMGTASSIYSDFECKTLGDTNDFEEYCRRTKYAIYYGLCSGIGSLLMVAFKSSPYICHLLMAMVVLTTWILAIAYLTFGDGPGTVLGNIYFASWIGFFLSMNLCTTSLRYLMGKGEEISEPDAQEDKKESAKENSKHSSSRSKQDAESNDVEAS